MTAPRHRAPPPPPLWARLNQPTPHRLAVLALATFGTFALGVAGIADGVGDGITPARSSAALPSRAEEPTGRGGPVAPIFADVDAPDYSPEPAPPVSTPQGQVTVPPQRAAIATSAPRSAASPPAGNPITPTPTPVQPAPAEPEPVVGLPVIEPAEPAVPVDEPIEEVTTPTPTAPALTTEPIEAPVTGPETDQPEATP